MSKGILAFTAKLYSRKEKINRNGA